MRRSSVLCFEGNGSDGDVSLSIRRKRQMGIGDSRAPCGNRRRARHGSPHPADAWRHHHNGHRHQQNLGLRNRRSGPSCQPGQPSFPAVMCFPSQGALPSFLPRAALGPLRGRNDAN